MKSRILRCICLDILHRIYLENPRFNGLASAVLHVTVHSSMSRIEYEEEIMPCYFTSVKSRHMIRLGDVVPAFCSP